MSQLESCNHIELSNENRGPDSIESGSPVFITFSTLAHTHNTGTAMSPILLRRLRERR